MCPVFGVLMASHRSTPGQSTWASRRVSAPSRRQTMYSTATGRAVYCVRLRLISPIKNHSACRRSVDRPCRVAILGRRAWRRTRLTPRLHAARERPRPACLGARTVSVPAPVLAPTDASRDPGTRRLPTSCTVLRMGATQRHKGRRGFGASRCPRDPAIHAPPECQPTSFRMAGWSSGISGENLHSPGRLTRRGRGQR